MNRRELTWRECWEMSGVYWYQGPCFAIYWLFGGKGYRIRTLRGWFRDWHLRTDLNEFHRV